MNGLSFWPKIDVSPKFYTPDGIYPSNDRCLISLSVIFYTQSSMWYMDVFIALNLFNTFCISALISLIFAAIYSELLNSFAFSIIMAELSFRFILF